MPKMTDDPETFAGRLSCSAHLLRAPVSWRMSLGE